MQTNSSIEKRGLIIVDLQKDFCPGGALPAAHGNEIVPVINDLLSKFDFIIASKDWHPQQTVHFEKWPVHCVRGTSGADFHEDLQIDKIDLIALKGVGNTDDGYSDFEATNIDLAFELKRRNIQDIYISGIATEYCVMATALDALKSGFKVHLITDAIAAVELKEGDREKAVRKMAAAGVLLTKSTEIR